MHEPLDYPIREFADRGAIWLLESAANLRDFVGILAADLAGRLDFGRLERINRSFVPDDLRKQETDLLHRVPYLDGTGEVWVYLLVEHQSRPDPLMGVRLLGYMAQIWQAQVRHWEDQRTPPRERRLYPVIPVVFYTGRRPWRWPLGADALMDVPAGGERFVPRHDTLFLDLARTQPEQLTGSAVAAALRVLQAADLSALALLRAVREAVGYLEALPAEAQAEWRRAVWFIYQVIVNRREPEEYAELAEPVDEVVRRRGDEEVGKVAQTIVEAWKAEGKAEGRLEALREMALYQLQARFGELEPGVVQRIGGMTERELTECGRRIVKAQSLADIGL
jgi:hypothetical protein